MSPSRTSVRHHQGAGPDALAGETKPSRVLALGVGFMRAIAGDAVTSIDLRNALSGGSVVTEALTTMRGLDVRHLLHPPGRRAQVEMLTAWRELAVVLDLFVADRTLACAYERCDASPDSRLSMCAGCLKVPCTAAPASTILLIPRRLLAQPPATVSGSSPRLELRS